MKNIIGTSVFRSDAPDKVRGKAIFAADMMISGMLHVSLSRSPVAHAILKGVKVPPLPEGCYVFTAKDLHENLIPSIVNEQPVLAYDRIRCHGEPFAIAAAPTKELADSIAASVEPDLEVLETVDSIADALDESKPSLFPDGNICSTFHSEKGNVEQGFKESFLIMEGEFETPTQIHGFLEPESAVCYIDENGKLVIVSSTQNAFGDLRAASTATGRPQSEIIATAATVGGAFGGKDGYLISVFPAIVSHLTGKPARFIYTREENIRFGMKRHKSISHAKVGFSRDGRILAADCSLLLDTGAYAVLGASVLKLGMEVFCGAYNVPNVTLDGKLLYTNHAPASAMKGFGAPQSAMAFENLLNRAAGKLGIDPVEIRKINAIHRGQAGSMGGIHEHEIALEEALDKFRTSDLYREMTENPQKDCGYGIAVGMKSSGLGKHVPDTCYASIRKDGEKYIVRTSLVDLGQGSRTTLSQIAAEALGVPFEAIDMQMGSTEGNPDSGSTAASRSTFVCGNAIIEAAKKIKAGSDFAEGSFVFPEPKGEAVHSYFAFMVQGAKVKVDPVTGKTDVLWLHSTIDAGRIINPALLNGQVFGGVSMSLGMALSEEIRYRNGKSMESGLGNYIMPTALDVPKLTNDFVEKSDDMGPYGAKGMAELPTVPVAPAITTAVCSLYEDLEINRIPIDRTLVLKSRRKR